MPNLSSPIPRGRIDLHSHLLPGIDDGCRTLDESIECVKRLMARGYVGTVCTPHVMRSLFPNNTPGPIAAAVAVLQEQLREAGLDYLVWPGGELRVTADTISWVETGGVPTLGNSRAVLMDWWDADWPKYADDVFDYFLERGYQPILAHPERMHLPDAELFAVLESLQNRGVLLQGNFNSMSGGEGVSAAVRLEKLLSTDRYHLMACDMHRPDSLKGRFAGLDLLERTIGPERVALYLEQRPREILAG